MNKQKASDAEAEAVKEKSYEKMIDTTHTLSVGTVARVLTPIPRPRIMHNLPIGFVFRCTSEQFDDDQNRNIALHGMHALLLRYLVYDPLPACKESINFH